jgi:hypothetical protein
VSRRSAWLEKLYAVVLHLYPADFRREFGEEMRLVFKDALQDTRPAGRGSQPVYLLHEVFELPGCLLRLYGQRLFSREGRMSAPLQIQNGAGGFSASLGNPHPSPGHGEILLAALPAVLMGIILSSTYLIVLAGLATQDNPLLVPIMNGIAGALFLLMVGFCAYAWRKGWPGWSGGWIGFVIMALAGLTYSGLSTLQNSLAIDPAWRAVLLTLPPLLLGYALYRITRRNHFRGLMAALPITSLTWTVITLEFVPIEIKTIVLLLTWLGLGLGTACILILSRRNENAGVSLAVALAINALIGLPYAWAGIYHGGMLPFSAPGPSPLEVIKVFLPQMLGSSALLAGPFLACLFSDLGRAGGKLGRFSYRLALLGVVFWLAVTILGTQYSSDDSLRSSALLLPMINALSIAGILLLFLGSSLLLGSGRQKPNQRGDLRLLALSVITLCLPSLLFLLSPFYLFPFGLGFSPLLIKAVPHAFVFAGGAAWMLGTIWLVAGWKDKIQGLL